MLKKTLVLILGVMLVLSMAVGCSQKPADNTGDTGNEPAKEVIELKLAYPEAPNSAPDIAMKAFAKDLEESSGGRIKTTLYGGQTLAKGPDTLNAVINGLADIGWNTATQTAGALPVSQLTTLPMLPIPDVASGSAAFRDLFENYDFLAKEYQDIHVLALSTSGGGSVIGTNTKLVKTLDDLKGLRIRVAPGPNTDFAKLAGAQPMNIPITEMWESMDKKTVDGYLFSLTAVDDFKLWEVTKYMTQVKTYTPSFWLGMNKAKYASLPDDLKKIVDECGQRAGVKYDQEFQRVIDEAIAKGKEMYKENYYVLPDDEFAKWYEIGKKAWPAWFETQDKAGYPSKEATEVFEELLKKYVK